MSEKKPYIHNFLITGVNKYPVTFNREYLKKGFVSLEDIIYKKGKENKRMDKFKLGDRVKNIINGKEGEVIGIFRNREDVMKEKGIFASKYNIRYNDGTRIVQNIVEIEKIQSILDDKEKEYLSDVIRPFRNNVEWICKRVSSVTLREYIRIKVSSEEEHEDYITLPYFNLGKMYKGMKSDKEYTLKEIEL